MKKYFCILAFISLVVAIAPLSTWAVTYTVNSTNNNDDGSCNGTHCSLREAVNAANANAGADVIGFTVTTPATINLDPMVISEDLTITGPGADSLDIRCVSGYRPFAIDCATDDQSVSVSDLTIAGWRQWVQSSYRSP